MDSQPDSALRILKTLNPDLLPRPAQKARYALLYSQALDKNYIDLESDSIIAPAVTYYSKHGNLKEKAYTYYYLGCIYCNAGNLNNAVESMVTARTAATKINDTYLLARIFGCLGRMYQDQHSFEEAETMFSEAEKCFHEIGDTANECQIIINKAITYSLMDKSIDAVTEYERVQSIYKKMGDSTKVCEMTRNIVNELQNNQKVPTDSLKQLLINTYSISTSGIIPLIDYPMWVSIYYKENNLDSARYYGIQALKTKPKSANIRCGIISQISQIEEQAGNFKKALEYWHEYYNLYDSLETIKKEQLIQIAEQRYQNQELEYLNKILQIKNTYTNIGWSIALIAGFFIIAYYFIRINHRYKQFIDTLNENYDTFKERYLQLAQEIDGKSVEETNLLKAMETKLKIFQKLLEKAYISSKPQLFIKEFKNYVFTISKNESGFADIQYVVNKRDHGLADYLRKQHPTLTNYELDLLCMFRFGFSTECVRLLYDHSNNNSVYNRRSKIHQKLNIAPRLSLEDYMADIVTNLKSDDISCQEPEKQ